MVKTLQAWIEEMYTQAALVSGALFDLRTPQKEAVRKVEIKPIQMRGETRFQFAAFQGAKVTHRNLTAAEAQEQTLALLSETYRQALFHTKEADLQVRVGKSGAPILSTRPPTKIALDMRHDRQKRYLLPEGEPIDFLIRLGVMTETGKVIAARYDKFRQINRFLEMVADVVGNLETDRLLRIVDFGSGKSYLTFALYYYLHRQKGMDVQIVGLDLKEDVIAHCSAIARDLGYSGLSFQVGDIRGFTGLEQAEMVVSLHACDTATDAALAKAVAWGAKVILAVPCCQHELFRQIRNTTLQPMLKHGIFKDRLTALVTDTLRAQMLEMAGYSVQALEFIEMEHTPKNVLLRAVRHDRPLGPESREKLLQEFTTFRDFWHLTPSIEALFTQTRPFLPSPSGDGDEA